MKCESKEFVYTHDHLNDTKMHVWDNIINGKLEITIVFKSEDDTVGEEMITFADKNRKMENGEWRTLASELLLKISRFLNKSDNGIHREQALRQYPSDAFLDEYTTTALFAFENILRDVLNKGGNEMADHFKVGTKVKVDCQGVHVCTNINTGVKFDIGNGYTGTVMQVTPCELYDPHCSGLYLIRFDGMTDKITGCPVAGWVPEINVSIHKPTKWYMKVRDAADMIVKEWREDPNKVYSFCESNEEEAKMSPEKHYDNGGWNGVKLIGQHGFFDNDPADFIAIVGHWGGGDMDLAYVSGSYADDDTCASELARAICDAADLQYNSYIYIEEEKETKEGK